MKKFLLVLAFALLLVFVYVGVVAAYKGALVRDFDSVSVTGDALPGFPDGIWASDSLHAVLTPSNNIMATIHWSIPGELLEVHQRFDGTDICASLVTWLFEDPRSTGYYVVSPDEGEITLMCKVHP